MKILAGGVVALLLAAMMATAQNPARTFTQPTVPPPEALDRLNLKLAWRDYLPMYGQRDYFSSVQVLDRQILVQTRSGAIIALDPITGATQWRARFGTPFGGRQALGYNTKSVFAVSDNRLYMLKRTTGELTGDYELPYAPSAAPVADDEQVYITLGTGRLYAFALPDRALVGELAATLEPQPMTRSSGLGVSGRAVTAVGPLSSAGQAGRAGSANQLRLVWEYLAETRLEQAPLLTSEFLLLVGTDGSFSALSKYTRRVFYRFQAEAPVSAALGQHGETAYLASQDYNVYAGDIVTGRILWRFVGGGAILSKPAVMDEDVFIAPELAGLYRLDRVTGSTIWRHPNAHRFLAANKKFVYATDRSGRLLILDRARGTQLAVYDGIRDFVAPIANEQSDRVYLASNNGLILCLHDRDYPTPLQNRHEPEPKPVPAQGQNGKAAAKTPPAEKGEMPMPEK